MDLSKIDTSKIDITLECLPEDIPVRGSFALGSEQADKEAEDRIIEDFNNGNPWAWCVARITASYGDYVGWDSLGACNYSSEEEFKKGGYYEDMKQVAIANLISNMEKAKIALDELTL